MLRIAPALALLPFLLVGPLLAGCASSATPTATRAEPTAEAGPQIFGDVTRYAFAKRLQIELPAKLAVADLVTHDGTGRRAEIVNALGEDEESYSDVVSLETLFGHTNEPAMRESYRTEASHYQAELMLLVSRETELVEDTNAFGILKLLLVPMLFVPTERDDVSLHVRALVADVRNGVVYTTFDDTRTTRITSTVVGEDDAIEAALDELHAACVENMRATLGKKLRALEKQSVGTVTSIASDGLVTRVED